MSIMEKSFTKPLLTILGFFLSVSISAKESNNHLIQNNVWNFSTLNEKATDEGLAGSFFGKQGNYFLLAGGSSFPSGKPWQGGSKALSDLVLVFSPTRGGAVKMICRENALPTPLAEGAYTTVASGLLCVGGQTPDGLTAQTLLLSYNGSEISVANLPDLPFPVKNAAATTIGNIVYLLGGECSDGTSVSQFLMLDIEHTERGWQTLPDFPVAVSGAGMAAQQDGEEIAVFVFGGRGKNNPPFTDFYSSVFRYQPSKQTWQKRNDIRLPDNTPMPLSMFAAAPVGASYVLLYGGDTGAVFRQVETAIHDENIARRDSLWIHHPGFNNKILIYNTVTDAWFEAGTTENPPVAVSANISDGKTVYVVGGEMRPGIRSPHITHLSFEAHSAFGWLNYIVLVVYFGGMLLLGFFFMKRNKDTEDYFKASGRIPWWAAGISIFATTLSAITFLSIPAKTYATDWRMLVFNVSILLIVPIVIRYFLPFFRRFNFSTAYQYLEVRFSRVARWLASALFVIFMVSRIAIVLFLPSLALHAVTGFNIYLSIIIMGVVTIVYSTIGGIEAVVWGDVVQGFILVFGAIAAFIFMIVGIDGGLSEFWNTSVEFHKFRTFDFRFDFTQPVFWVVLIGGIANSLITYTGDQSVVQRYMTTKDEKATSRSIWLNGFLSIPVSLLFFLIGTGLFAFYAHNPESMTVTNPNIDSVFPQFIVSEMPMGLAGLLIAAVFAAAMSTLSSNINSSSAVITSDFFQTMKKNPSERLNMQVARWSGILCGLFGMGMALVLATWNIASLWDQFNTFLGLLTCGLGALFILGIFFPRVGSKSALLGVVGGIVVLFIIKANSDISFLLYGFIGMVSGIAMAYLLSFVLPNRKDKGRYTWETMKNEK